MYEWDDESAPAPAAAKGGYEWDEPDAPAAASADDRPSFLDKGAAREPQETRPFLTPNTGPDLPGQFRKNIDTLVGGRLEGEDRDRGPVETFLRKGATAASSGFANPIAAKISSKISGQPYDEALKGINESDAAAETRNPVAGAAGTVAGTGLQLVAPLPIPKGTSTAGKIAHGAATGAVLGGASGAGSALTEGGDASDALIGAVPGAIGGAVLGAAIPATGAAVRGSVARSAAREPGAAVDAIKDVGIPHSIGSAMRIGKAVGTLADESVATVGRIAGVKPYSLTRFADAPPRVQGEIVPESAVPQGPPPPIDADVIPQARMGGRVSAPRQLGPMPIELGPISDTGGVPRPVNPFDEVTSPHLFTAAERQAGARDIRNTFGGDIQGVTDTVADAPSATSELQTVAKGNPGWSRNARGTGYEKVDTTPADANVKPRGEEAPVSPKMQAYRDRLKVEEDTRFAKGMGLGLDDYRALLARRAAREASVAKDRAVATVIKSAQSGAAPADVLAKAEELGLSPYEAVTLAKKFAGKASR